MLFNHKGGVGKTLLTANLACALTNQGLRVLLVDSDPQGNLTSFFIEDDVLDGMLDSSDGPLGKTLWSAMRPIVEADGDFKEVAAIERRPKLFLLAGDIRLAEFEDALGPLWSDCFQRKHKGFRGTTALSALVNQLCYRHKIDYVLYDCGPNIGPLNRVILLDCDHFIIPAACDLFSVRAVRTLGHTLQGWISDWTTISALAPAELYLLPGLPQLIGHLPQRFRIYGGDIASSQIHYLARIDKAILADVVAVLRPIDSGLVTKLRPLRIGEVKDFGSLASRSQRLGQPLWELDTGTKAQRQEALAIFTRMATEIERRAIR